MDTTVGVYGHMATTNMIKAFRRSIESQSKLKMPKKAVKKENIEPMKELTQMFISGEISEEVYKNKKRVLEEE